MYNESFKPAIYLDKIKALPLANLHVVLQAASQQAHPVNLEANYTSKTHWNVSLGTVPPKFPNTVTRDEGTHVYYITNV